MNDYTVNLNTIPTEWFLKDLSELPTYYSERKFKCTLQRRNPDGKVRSVLQSTCAGETPQEALDGAIQGVKQNG